jgi:hypothetical protein
VLAGELGEGATICVLAALHAAVASSTTGVIRWSQRMDRC